MFSILALNRARIRQPLSLGIVTIALAAAAPALATGISDDFESYATGAFPSPLWVDAGSLDPLAPAPPSPSATVIATTDAAGNPTQALAVADAISWITGVYQPVAVSSHYSLVADIRIDQYSDNPTYTTSDWAMQLTFAQTSRNLYSAPQAGIYASSLSQSWRLFLLEDVGSLSVDLDLGVAAAIGTWYRVGFDLDATSGGYRATIADIASGMTLVDQVGTFAGWTSANGKYDAVAFIEGEEATNPAITTSNLAVVDNVNVTAVPEPTVALLLGIGVTGLAGAHRSLRS